MKQQTAMQLLFSEFKALSETARFSGDEQTANLIDFLCEREPIALKKEEEQIKQAYNQGYREGQEDFLVPNTKDVSQFSNAQFYFTETYQ